MNDNLPPINDSGFDSLDCVDVVVTLPGDTTVRPVRPALRAYLLAEREKLIRYGVIPAPPSEPDGADGPTDGR